MTSATWSGAATWKWVELVATPSRTSSVTQPVSVTGGCHALDERRATVHLSTRRSPRHSQHPEGAKCQTGPPESH